MSETTVMSAPDLEPRKSGAPRHSRRHRRQRIKNLVMFGVLVGLIVLFFVLTLVRMEPPGG
jgi:hypothetical protein